MILNFTGHLTDGLTLAYRTPAERVRRLLPPGLELTTRGPWAYCSVTACRIEGLHLAGDGPASIGSTRHLILYRLHAQAMTRRIDLHRGLYCVRIDADAPLPQLSGLGAAVRTTPIHRTEAPGRTTWSTPVTGTSIVIEDLPPVRPLGSTFPTLERAVAWLATPATGLMLDGRDLVMLQALAADPAWRPQPVRVVESRLPALDAITDGDARLELAMRLPPLGCRWRLGHRERLLQPGTRGPLDRRSVPMTDDGPTAVGVRSRSKAVSVG